MTELRRHWPEYLMEASLLALFMVSAATFATLLQHPASPAAHLVMNDALKRVAMGIAMGLTAIALIYSPVGRRSGAHMNPAVTLTFYRLGKIAGVDALAYVFAQFAGAAIGITVAVAILGGRPADPSVNYVATIPGAAGTAVAYLAEALISFGLMTTVLHLSNHHVLARYTGLAAGGLVALYIVFEAPLSGMSMNPARTFGPALLAHTTGSLWVYFTAPLAGMLSAAELFVRQRGDGTVRCAKLHHTPGVRCIFRCGFGPAPSETPT